MRVGWGSKSKLIKQVPFVWGALEAEEGILNPSKFNRPFVEDVKTVKEISGLWFSLSHRVDRVQSKPQLEGGGLRAVLV